MKTPGVQGPWPCQMTISRTARKNWGVSRSHFQYGPRRPLARSLITLILPNRNLRFHHHSASHSLHHDSRTGVVRYIGVVPSPLDANNIQISKGGILHFANHWEYHDISSSLEGERPTQHPMGESTSLTEPFGANPRKCLVICLLEPLVLALFLFPPRRFSYHTRVSRFNGTA
jgi:hypothetical protein